MSNCHQWLKRDFPKFSKIEIQNLIPLAEDKSKQHSLNKCIMGCGFLAGVSLGVAMVESGRLGLRCAFLCSFKQVFLAVSTQPRCVGTHMEARCSPRRPITLWCDYGGSIRPPSRLAKLPRSRTVPHAPLYARSLHNLQGSVQNENVGPLFRSYLRILIAHFADTWMDLETHTEWSKSEGEKQISYNTAFM